jgi:hypothetical protein
MCGGVIRTGDRHHNHPYRKARSEMNCIAHNAPKKNLRIIFLLETIYFSSSLPGNEISKTTILFLAMQRYYEVH